MTTQVRRVHAGYITGWIVVIGLGLVAGWLLGVGTMGSHPQLRWPVLAGLGLGVTSALVVRPRPMLAAVASSSIAVLAAVSVIWATQVSRGFWPITDDFTIGHYGTSAQATMRAAATLLFLVVAPSVTAAVGVALVRGGGALPRFPWSASSRPGM